ncbi:MAG: hypothetical protein M3548_20035 [Actinomycetota bacterium]|nr:hypothetical protein [Actinomycetota bacterium]
MQRYRTIAGPPQQTSTTAWDVLVTLVSDTLAASQHITAEDVAAAFAPLRGLGSALISGGHLEKSPIVVATTSLHLSINVATGLQALNTDENLNPVPGGGSSTSEWMVYLPTPVTLQAVLSKAAKLSDHLSIDPAPAGNLAASSRAESASFINTAALDNLRASS